MSTVAETRSDEAAVETRQVAGRGNMKGECQTVRFSWNWEPDSRGGSSTTQ